MESKTFDRIIDSVKLPIEHFARTGFWDPYAIEGYQPEDISDTIVRSACRKVAKGQKRPFIKLFKHMRRQQWTQNRYVTYPDPVFTMGIVSVPKRKKLLSIVTPLLLAAPEPTKRYQPNRQASVVQFELASLWEFQVYDESFWDGYYAYALNDPECRKARGLTE